MSMGSGGGVNSYFFHHVTHTLLAPPPLSTGISVLSPVLLASRDQYGGLQNSMIDTYDLMEKQGTVNSLSIIFGNISDTTNANCKHDLAYFDYRFYFTLAVQSFSKSLGIPFGLSFFIKLVSRSSYSHSNVLCGPIAKGALHLCFANPQ